MLGLLFVLLCSYSSACCSVTGLSSPVNFSPVLSCLRQAIDLFVGNSSVVFFLDEIQRVSWSDALLKTMKKPKYVIEMQYARRIYGFYVLFPNVNSSYLRCFREKIHSRSQFLLVWLQYVDEPAVVSVFNNFWSHRYTNVVAMIADQMSFKFYTFEPYTKEQCGAVSKPALITAWNWTLRRFSDSRAWFPRRIRNFAGCPLKAIGNHQPPDNVMYFDGAWKAKGVGNKILRVAEQYLNFSASVIAPQLNVSIDHVWYYFSREISYISRAVDGGEADFAFGWYSYANMELRNIDASMELGRVSSIDCFGWAVPYRAGNKPPNFTYYVNEFKFVTWSLIVTILAACSLLFYVASRREFVLSTLTVLRTLLEQPIYALRTDAERTSFKILFTSFCFYSLVISAAYKASYSSFLSVPNQGREFKSVKDILNSSLQISGSPEMLKVVNDSAGLTNMGKAILRRYKILEPCDYAQIMTRLVRERNLAVLSVKRKMYYYAVDEAKRIRVKIPFRFIPGCLVRPHTTHLMFKRGSHLIEPFNTVLNRLFESGITTFWIIHLGTNRVLPLERLRGRKLKLIFLKEPLLMLVAGYVLGSVILICEILIYKRNKKKVSQVKQRVNLGI